MGPQIRCCHHRVVVEMSRERCEEAVMAALDEVPPELTALVRNCVVLLEDDPSAEEPELMGVFFGAPLPARDSSYTIRLPDRITIFRHPTLAMCRTEDEV